MNFRVVVEENNFPLKGGISTLIGIYPDKDSANFITATIKNKFKLLGEISIDEVDEKTFPTTSNKVLDYLQRQTI